jgi:hypothetical protein
LLQLLLGLVLLQAVVLLGENELSKLECTCIHQNVMTRRQSKVEHELFDADVFLDEGVLTACLENVVQHLIHHTPVAMGGEALLDRAES